MRSKVGGKEGWITANKERTNENRNTAEEGTIARKEIWWNVARY